MGVFEPGTDGRRRSPALFLFDIDGTLLTAGTAVHKVAFTHAYKAVYGLDLSLDGVSAAGRTDWWLLAEPLRRAGVPAARIDQGRAEAFAQMVLYVDRHLGDLRQNVLPGVPEVLAALHAEEGNILALLTGNLERVAHAKLRAAGLDRYFDTGGFGEESANRPDLVPVAIAKSQEAAGERIPAGRVIVIGDTPLDIAAGKAHGTRTCGVATGPFSAEELTQASADLVLTSLADAEGAVAAIRGLLGDPATRPSEP